MNKKSRSTHLKEVHEFLSRNGWSVDRWGSLSQRGIQQENR